MTAGAEIELKFLFAEKDSTKIKALVSAAAGAKKPAHQRLRAVYFDTPDSDLWKHRFILRVRATGKSHIQTIKQLQASSVHRGEWETEIGKLEPDLDLITDTPLACLAAKPSIRQALRPAFEVNVERTSYCLEAGGAVIEASLDRGTIEANGDKLSVRELELELKSGSEQALYNLARAFVAQAPLSLSPISKAERGHRLAEGSWGHPAKGSKPRLAKDMTCEEAFREICRTCLHDFHLNMLGLETLDDTEAVHQGRVAIRRLRAAIMLFKPMVFDLNYRKIRDGLKWLAGSFGVARDLDVLREKLLPRIASELVAAQMRDLVSRCEASRLRARQAAVEALNSERGRTLLLNLAVWIEDGKWHQQFSDIAFEPIQNFAGRRLKKRHKRLVRHGVDLAELAPGPRHKVRIDAKEMRYMMEFFVDVPGVAKDHKHLNKLIDCCEKLQTALGVIRDEEAMAELMEHEIGGDTAAANESAKTAILAPAFFWREKAGTEGELKKALRAYSQLTKIDAFWD